MKEKNRLESLYNFKDTKDESSANTDSPSGESERAQQLRKMTYRIEDSTAEIMNYNSIIETSKKSYKTAKKDYAKAKKKYDSKSFGALLFDIITFLGAFFSVYFLIKWYGEKDSAMFKNLLYISLAVTAAAFLVAVYKNLKVRPYRKKMKSAKDLMRDSKTWIETSEDGMKKAEEENRSLRAQKKNM